jgi:hypothetical protein
MFGGEAAVGAVAAGASAVTAVGWAGAALGRLVSIARDAADTPFNRASAGAEAAMALCVGGPWLLWGLGVGG